MNFSHTFSLLSVDFPYVLEILSEHFVRLRDDNKRVFVDIGDKLFQNRDLMTLYRAQHHIPFISAVSAFSL